MQLIGIGLLSTGSLVASPSSPAQDDHRPTAFMVSDAHLDTQWNWDIQATIGHHIRATLEQNLALMRHYPDYIFNFEGAVKYYWMKEYYPQYWQELTQRIRENRWHLAGSSWDANEVIVCSPESWIRNILLGQTFYRQEFGTESNDVFLPDCFGFPYYMPTAATHCGLIGFSSQKLMWRTSPFYEDGKKYPFTVGLWQGVDGSRIMMTHGFNYAQRYDEQDLSYNQRLAREIAESPLGIAFRYYGTGDTGGSADLPSVRSVVRGIHSDGPIKIVSAASDTIYKMYQPYDQHPELPVFDGELPMDVHGNACYTSQAAMKVYNRQLEHLGDATERAAVVADWLGVQKYPIEEMTTNWRRMIWHQFHDDLTGTSIPRAYEFSWNDELIGLKRFSSVLGTSVDAISRQLDTRVSGEPLVLYNTENFPVKTVAAIDLPSDKRGYTVADQQGKAVRSQVVRKADGSASLLFEATLPPTSFAVYSLKQGGKPVSSAAIPLQQKIENSRYRLTVDRYGDVTSIFDKQAQRELIAQGRALRLVVFDHCESRTWPAWEIQKATLDRDPLPIHDNASVSLVEDGPLRRTLRVTKTLGESQITQYISLYEGTLADRIDFRNEVEWRSLNALLKCEMPLSVSNPEATYDIGLGSVRRGNNRDNSFEVYSHEWTDLTDRSGQYGVTVLNDSRYGWDKPADNTLRLSLLYSPKCDDSYYRYQARQDFGYHEFTYSLVGHEGALDHMAAIQQSTALNSPVKVFRATKHTGSLGRSFSFVESSNPNVLVRTMKRAEVSDEYVVRLHEISGKADQQARLTFPSRILRAVRADGTEKELGTASFAGNVLNVDIKRFGLATYKVVLEKPSASGPALEKPSASVSRGLPASIAYQPLALTYDRKCTTYNEFPGAGTFDGEYSYAAELLPADHRLVCDNVPFTLGEYDTANGHTCKGDTLQLPEGGFTHVYLLAASDRDDRNATFRLGPSEQTVSVPYYTGFIGQWGHEGQTQGYLKTADIGYIGTHRHSSEGDVPYEFTYMFRLRLDVPKGARTIVLPNDEHIVLFAATAATDTDAATPAAPFFTTSNRNNDLPLSATEKKQSTPNLLLGAQVIRCTGYVNDREKPEFMVDGDPETKWCDVGQAPNIVDFDLGEEKEIRSWNLLSAGSEHSSYITRSCILMGRSDSTEEWRVIDMLDGNKQNHVDRELAPTRIRYVRLMVTGPTQETGDDGTRIYELELH